MKSEPNNQELTNLEYQELIRTGDFTLKYAHFLVKNNYRCPKKCSNADSLKNFNSYQECLSNCGITEVSGNYMAVRFMGDLLSSTQY